MALQSTGCRIPALLARPHCCAATTTADGRRMSINVETIGGGLMVQHYVEDIGKNGSLPCALHFGCPDTKRLDKDKGYLGTERQGDRQGQLRTHEPRDWKFHAGVPAVLGKKRYSIRVSQAVARCIRSCPQCAGDTLLRREYRKEGA